MTDHFRKDLLLFLHLSAPTFKMPPKPTATYTEALGNPRRHVGIHAEHVSAVSSTEYPGHYPNEDNSWDLTKFAKVRHFDHFSSPIFDLIWIRKIRIYK